VLAVAAAFGQAGAFRYVVPISIGIAVLLVIVAISYRQTIHAYPSGSGAYIVAKENLGTNAGLVAGASMLADYVLTVAVSITAGVAAITSMVQGTRFAWLDEHKVLLCLIFISPKVQPTQPDILSTVVLYLLITGRPSVGYLKRVVGGDRGPFQ